VFCDIVAGSIPAAIVHADAHTVAFLDHRPLFPGHVLLVPRAHVETLGELDPRLVDPLFQVARRLSTAVQRAVAAQGSFVAINNKVSQSVPHLHVHVVPRTKGDGLKGFFWPRKPYASPEQILAVATAIQRAMSVEP
jgi:histidine triad (HIT) family protein